MTGAIRIGIGLPTRGGVDPAGLLRWAARADEGPFSSLAVTDRVVFEALEPIAALAAAAAVTRRIRLLTSIVIAPTRETTLLARQAASIDALSGGRFTLGLGVGARTDDYGATVTSFETRGRRFDEQLPLLRRIWAGEPTADGFAPIGPSLAGRRGPELLIGGYVDAVARRIATWGDGFMAPGGGEPRRMAELWSAIRTAWTAAGRDGEPRWVAASYFALGPAAEAAASSYIEAWYGHDPARAAQRLRSIPTTADAVRELIQRQAGLGVDELILRPCSSDIDQLDRLAELLGDMAAAAGD
ncbi:MAG: LLM class flavin-dependent oxidoreductase [Chloroflexota bacterium]